MATPAALERVAFEAAEDARADGCVLAEFRIAPLLFEAHGVPGEAAVEALLAGLARSALPSGLIVCAMRHLPESETVRAAQLALRYQGRGVVGFDLAGAERGHPPADHARALAAVPRRRPAVDAARRRGRRRRAGRRGRSPGRAAHRPRRAAGRCAGRSGTAGPGRRRCANAMCISKSARPATCTPAPRHRSPPTRSRRCGAPAYR